MNDSTADPRERLVALGSQLLDELYTEQLLQRQHPEIYQAIAENRHEEGWDLMRGLPREEQAKLVSGILTHGYGRAAKLNEYVTLRQAIEFSTSETSTKVEDMPDIDNVQEKPTPVAKAAIDLACDVCFSKAGEPCTAPTNDGRRAVGYFHSARENAARG